MTYSTHIVSKIRMYVLHEYLENSKDIITNINGKNVYFIELLKTE